MMGALHDAIKAAANDTDRKAIKAQAWVDEGLAEGFNFNMAASCGFRGAA